MNYPVCFISSLRNESKCVKFYNYFVLFLSFSETLPNRTCFNASVSCFLPESNTDTLQAEMFMDNDVNWSACTLMTLGPPVDWEIRKRCSSNIEDGEQKKTSLIKKRKRKQVLKFSLKKKALENGNFQWRSCLNFIHFLHICYLIFKFAYSHALKMYNWLKDI